jgi:UDP-GlcNAc:undecaprenyl-phosphate GlcNAc-1-phosphate transferase
MTSIAGIFISSHTGLALLFSMALIPVLSWACRRTGLIDQPGGRKQHREPVPLAGGPAIAIALVGTLAALQPDLLLSPIVACAIALFFLGLLDDRFDLSPKIRLAAQAVLVTVALYAQGAWVSYAGPLFGFELDFGILGLPLTVLAVLGLTNAINMLDGADGLVSGILIVIAGFLATLAAQQGEQDMVILSSVVAGALLGFWAFNYRFKWRTHARVFMGDSGTMFLGFLVPAMAAGLAATPNPAARDVALPAHELLWIFALPFWDIVSVMSIRLREGRSVFTAGRDHVHHILMGLGLNARRTVHLIYLLSLLGISLGLALAYLRVTPTESVMLFLAATFIYVKRMQSFYNAIQTPNLASVASLKRVGNHN